MGVVSFGSMSVFIWVAYQGEQPSGDRAVSTFVAVSLVLCAAGCVFIWLITNVNNAIGLRTARRLVIEFEPGGTSTGQRTTVITALLAGKKLQGIEGSRFNVLVSEPPSGYGRRKAAIYLRPQERPEYEKPFRLYEWALPARSTDAFIEHLDRLDLLGKVTREQKDPWHGFPSIRESVLVSLIPIFAMVVYVCFA